ncbi:heavy-metal-associated domain-containing protein [Promicromonospora umidemergens]|uniref:heavy-metal-associated domain-containing protein n=1 Tax=Promicromonospora umidemergens TaxID=629679 RepID=UPI0020A383F7|nr:heavy metal-associated domain-containing protein [Promicromonospora umidemergens]
MSTVEIDVSTGGCEHCQRALYAELSAVPGVWRVRLDAPSGRVTFCAIAPVDRVQVAEAVADAGYELRAWH